MTSRSISLEVEDLGALLVALSKMPGDVKITLDLPTGRGTWQLTAKATHQTVSDAVSMAPSPVAAVGDNKHNKHRIKRGPAGRAARGIGRELLLEAIAAGTVARADLIKAISESGISKKGAQGVLERATRDKLVATNGRGIYGLSPKGRRVAAEQTTR